MSRRHSVLPRSFRACFRTSIASVAVAAVTATLAAVVSPAVADGNDLASVDNLGSFSLRDVVSGYINEATGQMQLGMPVTQLPGVIGAKEGTFSLDLNYNQLLAKEGIDPLGFGVGWGISLGSQVVVDGDVRVATPEGFFVAADETSPSGLQNYARGNLVFSQQPGVIDVPGIAEPLSYRYSLAHNTGFTEYFTSEGDIVARVTRFGTQAIFLWEGPHRLVGIIDGAGNRATVRHEDSEVHVAAPARGDGVQTITTLRREGSHLAAVVHPSGESTTVTTNDLGFVSKVVQSAAALDVTYHDVSGIGSTVRTVRVLDNGEELVSFDWNVVGERTYTGFPMYAHESELWSSGDTEFRYGTELSSRGARVRFEHDAAGALVSEKTLSTSDDSTVREETFQYSEDGSSNGFDSRGFLGRGSRPTVSTVIYRNADGGTREAATHTRYDETGRVARQQNPDGSVTDTIYATAPLPGSPFPSDLVTEQTTTGVDGTVSKTVNTLTADHSAIDSSETFVATPGNTFESSSRTEYVTEADGFVSHKRVVATNEAPSSDLRDVVTRFERVISPHDPGQPHTVSLVQTDAAGTAAETTTQTIIDTATGLTVETIDATGRRSQKNYDTANRVREETDTSGVVTTTVYENAVVRVTDPRGVTTSTYTDALGRLIKTTDNIRVENNDSSRATAVPMSDGHRFERTIESRRYASDGLSVSVTNGRGFTTTTTNDAWGRPTSVVTPTDLEKRTEYDDVANTVREGLVVAGGSLQNAHLVTERQRDSGDRVTNETVVRNDGLTVPSTTTEHDGLGRVTGSTNGDLSSRMALAPSGVASETLVTPTNQQFTGTGVSVNREFDLLGTSTRKTVTPTDTRSDSREGAREGITRVHDALGRVITETDQAGNVTNYSYTSDGLTAEVRNTGSGVVTRNTYDPETRELVMRETVVDGSSVVSMEYRYDRATGKLVAVFDSAEPESTRVSYTYDIFGNVITTTYPDSKTITHVFDEWGEEKSTTDVAGKTTTTTYGTTGATTGLRTSVTQTDTAGARIAHVEYEYDAYGRLTTLVRDGSTTAYKYTAASDVSSERTTRNDGTLVHESAYVYDTHGTLAQRIDTRASEREELSAATETETTTYRYNAFDQLVGSAVYSGNTVNGTPRTESSYTVGVAGEVTHETVTTLETTTTRVFERNALGQTTAVITTTVGLDGVTHTDRREQSYDAAGNLVRAANGTEYSYNSNNRLVTTRTPDGITESLSYWATGKQSAASRSTHDSPSETVRSSETTTTYWAEDTRVNDVQVSSRNTGTDTSDRGATVYSYLIGTAHHARSTNRDSETEYYLADRHGNVTAVTSPAGAVTQTYRYSDYGVPTTHSRGNTVTEPSAVPALGYAGEFTNIDGTQDLGVRRYSPTMMSFTTKDTADQFDLYAYANANPITLVDPTGESAKDDKINMPFVWSVVMLTLSVMMAVVTAGLSLRQLRGVVAARAARNAPSPQAGDDLENLFPTAIAPVTDEVVALENAQVVGASLGMFGAVSFAAGGMVSTTNAHNGRLSQEEMFLDAYKSDVLFNSSFALLAFGLFITIVSMTTADIVKGAWAVSRGFKSLVSGSAT